VSLLVAVEATGSRTTSAKSAWGEINKERLLANIRILSSDEFEGRAPGTKGEELTMGFLEAQFEKLGLKPGNPNGTYFQKVPMVGITADPGMQLVLMPSGGGNPLTLKYGDEFVAETKHAEPKVSMDAEVVFVGYGVVAPEYHWDDYKGVDVKGKLLVMLINDPPVADPRDASKLDEKTFKGKAMTYYGRWTYKYEIAADKHATGCLIVHETGPAGYPWEVVRGGHSGEEFSLLTADRGASRSSVEAWITLEKARALFAAAGKDHDALKKAAAQRDFKPVPLGFRASLTIHNKIRTIESNNVVAVIEGSDPELRNQYVIYSAHWDHFGIGEPVNGDKIYHGAADNASGVAGLLEIAAAFKNAQPAPRRSILFVFVTAEEQGLLGSEYYAAHPLYPLEKTAANINMDGLNTLGRTKDFVVVGLGKSSLDDLVKAVAAEQGRVVTPDAEPEKGFYYRSDHFNFAKQGVPALHTDGGVDFLGKPAGWGLEMRDKWTTEDYHKPSDQIKPYWDLAGAVQDLQILFEVGNRVANAPAYPTWKPGSEFKAKRDAMLRAVTSDR
jgi:Zn-dependent M28 family amino/carboxypeptidase